MRLVKAVACALSLLVTSCVCLAGTLRAVQPTTHEIPIEGGSVNAEDEIPRATVNALFSLLSPEALSGTRPTFYRIPQFPKLYAITANAPRETNDDYGLSLYVFQQEGATFKQLFRSKGMKDSYILRPTFFLGQKRTLIMAETGDETGTWQVHAFELSDGKVKSVGTLDAATTDHKNPDCWSNPILDAPIEFDGSYVIHVRGEVYVHPASEGQRKLPGVGWHRFVLSGAEFVYKPVK